MKKSAAKNLMLDDGLFALRAHLLLEAISRRAYELWEADGCQHGCDCVHWLQAEQEVRKSVQTH